MPESPLVIEHLVKYFGPTRAVDDISFTVQSGEIFGFLGPNGAGKTTTINCLLDFLRPTSGRASFFGLDSRVSGVEARRRVGFMPPVTSLNEKWTGQEHIDYARALRRQPDQANRYVKEFGLDVQKTAKQLSTGNRQKLSLILAFMFESELIVLDEPTNGLDPLLQQVVYRLIAEANKRGATIFMSSHNLAEVERTCTRVGILRQGKLIAEETMSSLQDKHLYTVQVWFEHDFDPQLFVLPNSSQARIGPRTLSMKYHGDVQPLLDIIARAKPHDVAINHASLEEHFMTFYNHHV